MRILIFGFILIGSLGAAELPTVENDFAPTTAKTLVFQEDLRFGGDDQGDSYTWSGVTPSIAASPNGHIFIGDPGSNRILEYDENGKYLKNLGKPGSGPSEYRSLLSFNIFKDGRAIGVDTRGHEVALVVYDNTMKYESEVRTAVKGVRLISFSSDAKLAMVERIAPQGNQMEVIRGWVDQETKQFNQISTRLLVQPDPSKFSDASYHRDRISEIMGLECGSRGLVGFGENGEVYTAMSNAYAITRWQDDKQASLIRKKFKPDLRNDKDISALIDDFQARFQAMLGDHRSMITRELITSAYEKSGLSEVKDPLMGFLALPDGHLLAVHQPDWAGTQTADIFDKDGVLVGTTSIKGRGFIDNEWQPRMVFRGKYAYTLETTDGEHQVVRYQYKLQ